MPVVSSDDANDWALLRSELSAVRKQYEDLKAAKERNDAKHQEDYRHWREFKEWLNNETSLIEEIRSRKRRKLDGLENATPRTNEKLQLVRTRLRNLAPLTEEWTSASPAPSPSKRSPKLIRRYD